MPKYARPNAYNGKQSSQSWTGQSRFANATEAEDSSIDNLAISPSTLTSSLAVLVPHATTSSFGVVQLTDNNDPVATKVYVDAIAIAGAPVADETTQGIGELATDAEAVAGTASTGTKALLVTPTNFAAVFAAPPATGGTTPAAGVFTTLNATGLITGSASATIDTAGTVLNLATDASSDTVNIGLGAARNIHIGDSAHGHIVTIGSTTGISSLTLQAGTGDVSLVTAGETDVVMGAAQTSGIFTIGGTSATGDLTLGSSDGINSVLIGNGTGATTVDISNSNTGGAVNVGRAFTTGAISIGGTTQTGDIILGESNATNAVQIANGSGVSTVSIAAVQEAGAVNIGSAMTNGTISLGGTSAQTGTITIGQSTAIQTIAISNGNGAKTIGIGNGISGNSISVGNGANTSAQTVAIAGGASAANSTVNILSGNGSAGTQTFNVLTGTRAGAINLATGMAAHIVSIGSSVGGAISIDTAAGVNIIAATASEFSVNGASQDLRLAADGGSINLHASEAAIDALSIKASNAAGGIDCDSGTGGTIIDSTGAISLDAAAASNFSVSGAGIDLNLESAGGRVVVDGGEAAADAVVLITNNLAGGIDIDAGTGGIAIDTTGAYSIDGASPSNVSVSGAGNDLTLSSSGGRVFISGAEAVSDAIEITAPNAAGGVSISSGTSGVVVSGTGSFLSLATTGAGLRVKSGAATDSCGTVTLVSGSITVLNTNIAAGDLIFVTRSDVNASTALGVIETSITAGDNFTIQSKVPGTPGSVETGDVSDVDYFIVRPL